MMGSSAVEIGGFGITQLYKRMRETSERLFIPSHPLFKSIQNI